MYTLVYFLLVTPSLQIYPSNQPTRVNMRQEATMIGFDLLCDLKKVELLEHIKWPIHINKRTLTSHVSHLRILFLGSTDVLSILSLSCSHTLGMTVSRNPNFLSQAYLSVSRDPIYLCYTKIPRI